MKTSLDVLKEHSPTTDFFKLALRKLLCYSLVERMSCPTSEPAISWLADISHNLRAIGASDSQVDLVSQHLRDHAITILSALLTDVLVDESQLDVVINTLRDRMREAQNGPRVAQRHSPSRRDSALSNVDIEESTGPASKRRKVRESTASSDSPSFPAREFDFEEFRALDLVQRRMFATKTFSAPIELYFYHVRRSTRQADPQQISVVWSKLDEAQLEQWHDLLDRFRDGDIEAADTAGASLLADHDIISRVEQPKTQAIPFRGFNQSQGINSSVSEKGKGKGAKDSQPHGKGTVTHRSPYFEDAQ